MTHKQVIVLRKDLNMRKGKMVAQGSHASLGAILQLCEKTDDKMTLVFDDRTKPWILGNFKKICVGVDNENDLLAVYKKACEAGIIACLIKDNGLTEFNGIPTLTAVAIGPDYNEKIDQITADLKLL
jgi:PTH2 family peptidyl-tRNA hydrolase